MKIEDMTPYNLADMNEKEFDQATAVIAYHAERLHPHAMWLDECVDLVVNQFGSYERPYVEALDICRYTIAHTRHWCGQTFCRDS